jgi:hypothetical protein
VSYWDEDDLPVVTFWRVGHHVASKPYTCRDCGGTIPAGTKYHRYSALVDGEFVDDKRHSDMGACLMNETTEP